MDQNNPAHVEKVIFALNTTMGSLPQEKTAAYYQFLVDSDAQLKANILYFETGIRPALPKGGSIDLGIMPYWLANPDKIPGRMDIPHWVLKVLEGLVKYGLVPPPTITDADYAALLRAIQDGTAIAEDGSIFGENPYEQLDFQWLQVVVNDALTTIYGKAGFGGAPPKPSGLTGASGGAIKIAIMGDWGTGENNARDVVKAAMDLSPDYLIHLGDVYYTGTPDKLSEGLYWGMGNEADKLVNPWPSRPKAGTSFTLNSNHEMYCGGHGYFDDALNSSTFSGQSGKSYFLLENDSWQIFGLDSAYASPAVLYMTGALNPEQIDYIQNHHDAKKKTIIMTHHNAYDITGKQIVAHGTQSLWEDVVKALGGKAPDYWYWGHLHTGVVYNPIKVGDRKCHFRCVGHASIPCGAPWRLSVPGSTPPFTPSDYIDTVAFVAGTPVDPSGPGGQVKNGFAMITLENAGITEAMYDSDGKCTWPPSCARQEKIEGTDL